MRDFCMKCYLLYSFYRTNPLNPEQNSQTQKYLWFSLKASLCDTLSQ